MDRVDKYIESEELRKEFLRPFYDADSNDDGTVDWIIIYTLSTSICEDLGFKPLSIEEIENINTYQGSNSKDPDFENFDKCFLLPILKHFKNKSES